jgi:hypothetical protein
MRAVAIYTLKTKMDVRSHMDGIEMVEKKTAMIPGQLHSRAIDTVRVEDNGVGRQHPYPDHGRNFLFSVVFIDDTMNTNVMGRDATVFDMEEIPDLNASYVEGGIG